MAFRLFTISIHDAGLSEAELNGFFAATRCYPTSGAGWNRDRVRLEFLCRLSGADFGRNGRWPQAGQRGKVDYKEVLSPEDF